MYKNVLHLGIILLFFFMMAIPSVFGYIAGKPDQGLHFKNYYNHYTQNCEVSFSPQRSILFKIRSINNPSHRIADGPMDSPWPMYCHDSRHTGRSPYNTAGNPGFEKWWFKTGAFVEGSGAIDNEGVIYFGSHKQGDKDNFFAMYPNSTIKWSYDINGNVASTGPAIDENGIIYVGTAHNTHSGDRLFAFYPDGTVKWTYFTDEEIFSSPVIDDDGTIFFCHITPEIPYSSYITALFPNGTLKWRYKTNHVIYSDPAIGLDGTVYCGCHNGKLYALYPNNGTLKWRFSTGDWVARGPCIADDGTIIFGSWDSHLYACHPDGSLKWKTYVGAVTTPVIGIDGNIYVGNYYLSAINPENGSIKWQYDIPGYMRGGNPCVSADGIIYCGTIDPGYLVAVNPDGTERWKKYIGECHFAPIIGEDGTVYVGSSNQEFDGSGYISVGYLHAFNEIDPDAPSTPEINGPTKVNSKTEIDYNFKSTSPLDNDVYFYIDWSDGDWKKDWWLGPYSSGENAIISHTWSEPGTYTIKTRCKDSDNLWSDWSEFKVTIPRNRVSVGSCWLRFLNIFPILQKILNHFIRLEF